jgi:hypothetical protein
MSDMQHDSDTVLHQDAHESIVDEMLDGQTTENVVIADLVAITGGEAPTETEHNLVVTKVNAILAALRSSGVIPSA